MQDFPPNSRKARETEPREPIKPVTSAQKAERRNGLGDKFKRTFFSGTGREAMGSVVEDVVVPTIREMISEGAHFIIDSLIFGERSGPRHRHRAVNEVNVGRVDYAGISRPKTTAQRSVSRRSRARHDFADLVISTKAEANDVLDIMYERLSRYGEVSVADLYELTDVQSTHTDMKWGWTNLRGAQARPLRQGGYLLDLPTPEELR